MLNVMAEGDRDSRRTRKCLKILRGKGKASHVDSEVSEPQAKPVGYRQKIKTQWNAEQCRVSHINRGALR